MRDQQIRPRVEIRERILEMTKAPPKPPTIPESAKRLKYGIKWNPICDQRTGKLIAQMPDVLIEREILRNYDRAIRQRVRRARHNFVIGRELEACRVARTTRVRRYHDSVYRFKGWDEATDARRGERNQKGAGPAV